jgi:hypothetical protein
MYFSETSVNTQRTTRRYIPEDGTLHNHRCENIKPYKIFRNLSGDTEENHDDHKANSLWDASLVLLLVPVSNDFLQLCDNDCFTMRVGYCVRQW